MFIQTEKYLIQSALAFENFPLDENVKLTLNRIYLLTSTASDISQIVRILWAVEK